MASGYESEIFTVILDNSTQNQSNLVYRIFFFPCTIFVLAWMHRRDQVIEMPYYSRIFGPKIGALVARLPQSSSSFTSSL